MYNFHQNIHYCCVYTHIYIIITDELSKKVQQCSYINYLNTQGEATNIVCI